MSHVTRISVLLAIAVLAAAETVCAHPIIENALDVVVGPDRIAIDARISQEEINLVESERRDRNYAAFIARHAEYVRQHVQVFADGEQLSGEIVVVGQPSLSDVETGTQPPLIPYQLTFSLARPPVRVAIEQDFLREFEGWTAPCVLRIRRADQDAFDLSLLPRGRRAELDCEWPAEAAAVEAAAVTTNVSIGRTAGEYFVHGVEHILTGPDHLLFVTALVLAARSLWELVKVVAAFTAAHTLTLALSTLHLVHLSEQVVEPMIAGSIIVTALQNVFFPRASHGWSRLAIAFGFGLFHGLGFAGGLQDALAELPALALWLGLIFFSLGVEAGHQVVILPAFALLGCARRRTTDENGPAARWARYGSLAVAAGGVYFLVQVWPGWAVSS